MYSELIRQINEARSRSAVFYKTDLHVHSNESDDFPSLGDKPGCTPTLCDQDKNPTARDFIHAAEKAGLSLIAITDHNRSRTAEEIAHASSTRVTALPGMEVNLQTSFFPESTIHVLAIFPREYTHADIDKVFPKGVGMPLYSNRTDACYAKMPVSEFIKRVSEHGGISIASHVNSTKGVRSMFRSSSAKLLKAGVRQQALFDAKRKRTLSTEEAGELRAVEGALKGLEDQVQEAYLEFIIENKFDAVEIGDPDEKQYYTGVHVAELGLPTIPCVVGSDAHNLGDIGLPGFATYVKMTEPGLDDLVKALKDPGTRIRFEPSVHPHDTARILGITFSGGFFMENVIGFSDNLTCLIGGRGSGKSATIEALRYVFHKPIDHLPPGKRKDIDDRKQHTLSNTEIRVLYQDENGDTYIMKRQLGELATQCFDKKGNPCSDIGPAVSDLLKVRVFGWGEIEELARSKADQLALIDGFVPQANDGKEKAADCMSQVVANTSQIVQLAREIEALTPRVRELPGKKEQLRRLTSPELVKVFQQFDQNQAAAGAADDLAETIRSLRSGLVQPDGSLLAIEKTIIDAIKDATPRLKSYSWFSDVQSQVRQRGKKAGSQYKALLTEMDSLAKIVDGSAARLRADKIKIDGDLNRYAEKTKEADAKTLLSRRKTLKEEVDALQRVQDEIDRKQKSIKSLLDERWKTIVPTIEAAMAELTGLRSDKLKDINHELSELSGVTKVSVGIVHLGDRMAFERALGSHEPGAPQGILRDVVGHYKDNRYARRYAAKHTPDTFVRAVLDRKINALKLPEFVDQDRLREPMTEEQAERVWGHLSPMEEDRLHYDGDKLQTLLELEHVLIEDLPSVCLGVTPIEELSPGQRCSALIPIILLEGDCPLVIDQPEDNLDNRLVFGLVVDILRSLKERRQIIVATHNPNIPVSGDAEQIVVFSAKGKEKCEPVVQGSIDCADIIQHVMAIMEGSEEAFRMRAQKYEHHLR